jgi:hypothetical protein
VRKQAMAGFWDDQHRIERQVRGERKKEEKGER